MYSENRKSFIHKYHSKTSNHSKEESTDKGNENCTWNKETNNLKQFVGVYIYMVYHINYIYIYDFYQNIIWNANQKITIGLHTKKEKAN